jgi:hypothetical protein
VKSRRGPGEDEVNLALKALKNVFVRDFVACENRFSPTQMSTALLLVACHCLIDGASETVAKRKRSIPDASMLSTDDGCLAFCRWLWEQLMSFCPLGIEQAMPPPEMAAVRIVKKLLSEECWRSLGKRVSSIGFTYEILGLAARKEALLATQTANKELRLEQLIAFTQLYTPDWVVDYLIANTLLPVLEPDMRKDSFIDHRYGDWLFKQPAKPRKKQAMTGLKLIDPACGSGQFLLSAFDLFYGCYRATGVEPAEAAKLVLAENIFGADIDVVAIWTSSLGLLVKSLLVQENSDTRLTNLCLSVAGPVDGERDLLGSISRDWLKRPNHVLNRSYDAVVTNPPYIGRKSLSRELKISLKRDYPRCSADICAAFLERCCEMLSPGGRMGIITQSSLLTLPSYRDLREHLLSCYQFDSVIHCGTGVFPRANGEKIDSVLLVAQAPVANDEAVSPVAATANFDLRRRASHFVSLENKAPKSDELRRAISRIEKRDVHKQQSVSTTSKQIDNLADRVMQSLKNAAPLSSVAQVKQGLATTDNQRFVRCYWDICEEELGSVWVPYIKGAGSERWYSDNNYVVKWGKDGSEIKQAVVAAYPYLKGKSSWVVKNEQFYFKPGLCFSFINKHHLAVRRLPAGCIFDVASSAIFPEAGEENFLFAYLNSTLLSTIANLINPTINLQVGDIKRLPMIALSNNVKAELSRLAQLCYEKKRDLNSLNSNGAFLPSTNGDTFKSNCLVPYLAGLKDRQTRLCTELIAFEEQIDELVFSSFLQHDYLKAQDVKELRQLRSNVAAGSKCGLDSLNDQRTLAAKVIVEAVSRLMLRELKEQVTILPVLSNASIREALGLDKGSQDYLESMLGVTLSEYFRKSAVLDLSKAAKNASRYFSVCLPESKGLVFLSTRAMKLLINSGKQNGDELSPQGLKLITPADQNAFGSKQKEELHDYTNVITEALVLLKRNQVAFSNGTDWSSIALFKALSCAIL